MPHGLNDKEIIEFIRELVRLRALTQRLLEENRILQKLNKRIRNDVKKQ